MWSNKEKRNWWKSAAMAQSNFRACEATVKNNSLRAQPRVCELIKRQRGVAIRRILDEKNRIFHHMLPWMWLDFIKRRTIWYSSYNTVQLIYSHPLEEYQSRLLQSLIYNPIKKRNHQIFRLKWQHDFIFAALQSSVPHNDVSRCYVTCKHRCLWVRKYRYFRFMYENICPINKSS